MLKRLFLALSVLSAACATAGNHTKGAAAAAADTSGMDCDYEAPTGSNMIEKNCVNSEERRRSADNAKDMLQQPRANPMGADGRGR